MGAQETIDGSTIFDDPDAELRGMLVELEEAEAQWRIADMTGGGESLRDLHRSIRRRIESTPALGPEGVRCKARAAELAAKRDSAIDVEHGGFVRLAMSLVLDVLETTACAGGT